MTTNCSELADLGWKAFHSSQLDQHDDEYLPARVTAVHRGSLQVLGPSIDRLVPPLPGHDDEEAATVGDWLLLEPLSHRPVRVLTRSSLFKRRAPGSGARVQLIAANVDTLLIVSSCNQDFNVARLERYLVLARDAEVTPVVVLTKADLADAPAELAAAAARLSPGMAVETVDARDPDQVARLACWCGRGETVAFVGSSGVGKSTLINTLLGEDRILTQGVRAGDDKGHHTTTGRTLHRLPAGGWLLDTPGMRELQLTDVADGLQAVFAEIDALARRCRFGDCRHESEPGCAVLEAVQAGTIDGARLRHWRKLVAEERHNSEGIAERRQRHRRFGKQVKRAMEKRRTERGW